MRKIIIRKPSTKSPFSSDFVVHPVLQHIYAVRGINSPEQIECDLKHLLPFHSLKDIEKAASYLCQAIYQQKKLLIIGDFDTDGATSTALAVRVLRKFGAKQVDFLVPNRFEYGYGLTPEIVRLAATRQPNVIITVDNGISSCAGVATANQLGIDVIITDHHLAGNELPAAFAIINPNQPDDDFPSKNLAGVGVIFYLLLAVRVQLRQDNWFAQQQLKEPNLADYLDIVALGTVADVVMLDKNNRILVQQGLRRIRAGRCVPGIAALLEVGKRQLTRLTAVDLGFTVAPRLNAAGRLDDMSLGINCLLTDDIQFARQLADELDSLNQERRLIEEDMQQQAIVNLRNLQLNEMQLPVGLCLFDENWHQGVIGILASRIKDRVHRPVFIFAAANELELKASGRSVNGVHLRDVLANINAQYPELIIKFGGHAMAAGLTLLRDKLSEFSRIFDEEVRKYLSHEQLQGKIYSDGELSEQDLCLELAELIQQSGPWGQGFPEPLFDGKFKIKNQRLLADKHLKLLLQHGKKFIDAIAFNIDNQWWAANNCEYVHLAYHLDINEYNDKRSLQLLVQYIEPIIDNRRSFESIVE